MQEYMQLSIFLLQGKKIPMIPTMQGRRDINEIEIGKQKQTGPKKMRETSLPSLPQSGNSNTGRTRRRTRVVGLFAHILEIGSSVCRRRCRAQAA